MSCCISNRLPKDMYFRSQSVALHRVHHRSSPIPYPLSFPPASTARQKVSAVRTAGRYSSQTDDWRLTTDPSVRAARGRNGTPESSAGLQAQERHIQHDGKIDQENGQTDPVVS